MRRATTTVLTEKIVAGLDFRGKEYVMWDASLPGFGVRVWKGGKAYIGQFKVHSVDRRKTFGACNVLPLAEARERARKYKGAISDGRDPFLEEQRNREAWTLRDAMDYFLGDYAARRKLAEEYKADSRALSDNHFPRAWWSRKLSSFSTDEIARKHADMEAIPRRAKALLQLLSRLFTLGMEKGHCDRNPVKGIKPFEQGRRDRFLTDRELQATWRRLKEHKNTEASACVMLILLTGCRPNEAYTAEWSDFDLGNAIWRKPGRKTKQRKPHIVRLSKDAVKVLQSVDTAKRSAYVFPSPDDPKKPRYDIRRFWETLREDLALPDVRLYDLRHTFASHLTMMGAGPFEVKEALGHASITTTQRYVHLADDTHRQVAELMSKKLKARTVKAAKLPASDVDQVPRQVAKRGKKVIETGFIPLPDVLKPIFGSDTE